MSQEIVRRVYDAAARRDPATVLALYDPEVELDNTRLEIVGGAGASIAATRASGASSASGTDAWESIDYDFDELIDAGDECVISVVTRRGRGRASGAEVEWSGAHVWTIRDGKVVRVVWLRAREEALEAAGPVGGI